MVQVDYDKVKNAASRGGLPVAYLTSDQDPADFLRGIRQQVPTYMCTAASCT